MAEQTQSANDQGPNTINPDTSNDDPQLRPYRSTSQVTAAMRQYNHRGTKMAQRGQILMRLAISGRYAVPALPELLKEFNRSDLDVRHGILDCMIRLAQDHTDLSELADEITRFLVDSNYLLRKKIVQLVCLMAPIPASAFGRILTASRSAIRDIRLSAVEALETASESNKKAALQRIEAIRTATPATDLEMIAALDKTYDKLTNTKPPAVSSVSGIRIVLKTNSVGQQIATAAKASESAQISGNSMTPLALDSAIQSDDSANSTAEEPTEADTLETDFAHQDLNNTENSGLALTPEVIDTAVNNLPTSADSDQDNSSLSSQTEKPVPHHPQQQVVIIVNALELIAQQAPDTAIDKLISKLDAYPVEIQGESCVRCLNSPHHATRYLAARLLQTTPKIAQPFLRNIITAHKNESDLSTQTLLTNVIKSLQS